MEQGKVVNGIACDKNVARISILGVEDKPGVLARVFAALADNNVNVDIIVQSGAQGGKADFSFTVVKSDAEKAINVMENLRSEVSSDGITSETDLIKISIVGAGMVSNPGVAAKMFDVISKQGISIKMVSTSDIKVSCVIDSSFMQQVIAALHTAFDLDTTEQAFVGGPQDRR